MMTEGYSHLFVDTNILLYSTKLNSPWRNLALQALETAQGANIELFVSTQILREYIARIESEYL